VLFGELFYERDIQRIFFPAKRFLLERLARGELPHWWPFDALGNPYLASPLHSTFHPSTLLYLLLPWPSVFTVQVLLSVPLGLACAYRLARVLGCRAPFALLAAAAYVFSGYTLGLLEFIFSALAAAVLPGFLAAAVREGTPWLRRVLTTALWMALILTAGDPVIAVLAVLMAGALLLAPRAAQLRQLAAVAAGSAIAALLSAVQLLPAALLMRESTRAEGLSQKEVGGWSLGWDQVRGFVAHLEYAPEEGGFVNSTFLGITVLLFAAAGVVLVGRRHWRWVLLGALSLVLATGHATPMWELFNSFVPFWKSFRYPIKALLPAVLCIALLAALGAQALWRLLRRQRPYLPRVGAWAPALLVLADLAINQRSLVRTVPPSHYDPPALAQQLAREGFGLRGYAYTVGAAGPGERGADPRLGNAHVFAALGPDTGALFGLPSTNAYLPSYSLRFRELAVYNSEAWMLRLAGVFSTRAIVLREEVLTERQRKGLILGTDAPNRLVALGIPRVLPRAYTVASARVLPRAQVVEYLVSPAFKPGREVVLEAERTPAGWAVQGREALAVPAKVSRWGDSVEVEAELAAPGFLVLNESYFEGVRAWSEGVELPVVPANHIARAVALPAGRHRVRFTYVTPGFAAGAWVSLVTAALVAGALLWERRRRSGPGYRSR
jgi:hypothetical protein